MESNWGRRFKSITSTLTLAAVMAAQIPAYAQGAGVSEQLYRQGQDLMKAGNVHEACAKFDASYRADTTAVGSLTALAACHEKEGKIASAWGEYTTVATIAQRNGETDRQAYASDHAKQLEPKLHHVILKPGFDAATAPSGMSITLDGLPFTLGALNSSVPIDSGDHALSVTAPEKKPFEKKFTSAADTGTDTIDIPALEDLPKNAPPPITSTPEDHSTHWNTTKLTVGIALGVVGLGGIGTAIGLGVNASSLNQKSIT
ncbi:MAG TPA: hypothetical protein VF407_07645, partial [Polyangiaceae bacterium]